MQKLFMSWWTFRSVIKIVNNWAPLPTLLAACVYYYYTLHYRNILFQRIESPVEKKNCKIFGHNRNKKYHKTKNTILVLITRKILFSEKNMLTKLIAIFLLKQHIKTTNNCYSNKNMFPSSDIYIFRRPKMKMECYQICCCNFDYRPALSRLLAAKELHTFDVPIST